MRQFLGLILAGCLVIACACGELRPVPAPIEPQAYKAHRLPGLDGPRQGRSAGR